MKFSWIGWLDGALAPHGLRRLCSTLSALFACAGLLFFCSEACAQTVSGTGFFVAPNGYIVTNAHVVVDMEEIWVRVGDGTVYPADFVGADRANDIAILKVKDGAFRALPIRSSTEVRKGSTVFTIGFPNSNLQGSEAKITEGIVSSLSGYRREPNKFQISVPIQPGNSGGPLIDASGAVVGIVSAKLSAAATLQSNGTLPENVNYAVKSNYLMELIATVPTLPAKLKKPGAFVTLPLTSLVAETEKSVVFIFGPYHDAQAPSAAPAAKAAQGKPRYELDAEAARWYRLGLAAYNEKRYTDALPLLGKAGDLGHADAQVNVGYMYELGLGVSKDVVEALRWYTMAANQGNAMGQNNLAYFYKNGIGTSKDGAAAEKWYRLAAEQGLAPAQYHMGSMYLNGDVIEKNYDEAYKWLAKAAAQGQIEANVDLGYMYQNGFGVPKDYAEAAKWYRLPIEKGNATAIANMKILDAAIAAEEERRAKTLDESLAAEAQRRKAVVQANAAKITDPSRELVGTVAEVNAKYGFVTIRTDKTVPPDARLVFDVNGREIGGHVEKQSGALISVTIDGGGNVMPAVGSRVYLRH